jgi:threonine/homoserine/homoserine lactone efflux protein
VLGIQSGTLAWGVLTSAGVTALLTASQLAYTALRRAGAGYLIWLGLGMLWAARRLRKALRRPAARQWLDRITGTVVAGFGVRLAAGTH